MAQFVERYCSKDLLEIWINNLEIVPNPEASLEQKYEQMMKGMQQLALQNLKQKQSISKQSSQIQRMKEKQISVKSDAI